jgi:hypothetical protein
MDLEWESVPIDLQGNAWNIERLIYRDHRMVVPIETNEELKLHVVPPKQPSREHSDKVLNEGLKVKNLWK